MDTIYVDFKEGEMLSPNLKVYLYNSIQCGRKLMKMLIAKFLTGKFSNEGELFTEPITKSKVKFYEKMIAQQTLHTLKKCNWKIED